MTLGYQYGELGRYCYNLYFLVFLSQNIVSKRICINKSNINWKLN